MPDTVEFHYERTSFLYQSFCQQSLFLFSTSSVEITYNDARFLDTIVTLLLEWFLWLWLDNVILRFFSILESE